MEILARFHPQISHAPIALLLVGLLFELIGLAVDRPWWRKAATALLVLGTAGAILAALSGRPAAERALAQQVPEQHVQAHEIMSYLALWYALGALVLRAAAARVRRFHGLLAGLSLIGWIVACAFVVVAAQRGITLVLDDGAGVRSPAQRLPETRQEPPLR